MKAKIILSMAALLLCGCDKKDYEPAPTPTLPGRIEISASTDARYPAMYYTPERLEIVRNSLYAGDAERTKAYLNFMQEANLALQADHHAVGEIYVSKFYDENDEGKHLISKLGMLLDTRTAYTCALAYMVTGREIFAYKAIYILNAWARVNKRVSTLDDSTLCAVYSLLGVLAAADLLMGQPIWSDADKALFRQWLTDVFLPPANAIKTRANNWGDWGTYGAAAAQHLLGDESAFAAEAARLRGRIGHSITAVGDMPEETRREINGLWYTYFALTPMCMCAELVQNRTGENLFTYVPDEGGSIKQALDYLFYYVQNKDQWPHYPMSKGSAQTGGWPVDLFEAMNDHYDDEYVDFVKKFRPINGGFKSNVMSHTTWFYPTFMRKAIQ